MKTHLTRGAEEAAQFIKTGGVVAFPTETVYGLGSNVFDEIAVSKIFAAKQRPADNPLIAHVSSVEQIAKLSSEISENAKKFIEAFFPGPLTVVVTKAPAVPLIATAGLETIGIRMPRFELAREFIECCGVPLVAPSANLSGRPSPTTWEAVLEDLDGRIDCILQGEPTEIGLESTVVDCSGDIPLLLRAGGISLMELQAIVSETAAYRPSAGGPTKSPGVKHRHYSPNAEVVLVDFIITDATHPGSAYIGMDEKTVIRHFDIAKICTSVDDYAHSLFEFFRECDRLDVHTIYCEIVPETGIGAALMDRLRRAAEE